MRKLLLSLTLAFVMAFSCTTVGFAAVSEEAVVEPRATSSMNIYVSRESGTDGGATIDVNFANYVDTFTITVYLQKLSNGSWVNDTSNEDYIGRVTGSDRDYAFFDIFYDKLTRGTSYRLKVVSVTTYNRVTYKSTGYSQVF